jgi:hypothetical protein
MDGTKPKRFRCYTRGISQGRSVWIPHVQIAYVYFLHRKTLNQNLIGDRENTSKVHHVCGVEN